MKRLILFFSVVMLSTLPLLAEEKKSPKERKVRELLELTGASKLGAQMADGMIEALRGSSPGANEEFWAEFRKEINDGEIVELVVPVYMKHIEERDLDELIRFYKSPAGQRFVASQPAIVAESMELGSAWGEKLAMRALTKLKESGKTDDE